MAQGTNGIGQHKRLAMGQAVTGMKKGGSVELKEKESRKFDKMEGAQGERREKFMKKGGKCGK